MRKLLRYYLINLTALYAATRVVSGLAYDGNIKTLLIAGVVFAVINFLMVPLLKILFLPLNLLTLGLFAWLINVLAIYALTTAVSGLVILPYQFPGFTVAGVIIPAYDLSTFWVAVLASLVIGIITNFLQWLTH